MAVRNAAKVPALCLHARSLHQGLLDLQRVCTKQFRKLREDNGEISKLTNWLIGIAGKWVLFQKLKRSRLVSIHYCSANIKTFRQGCYVDFDERIPVDSLLQDKLTSSVVNVNQANAAVKIGKMDFVCSGVRINAESQRIMIVDANL